MTVKERKDQELKAIFKAINSNFTVSRDFEDLEGRGYFSFEIEQDGELYEFDMSRNYGYQLNSYVIRGDERYGEAIRLEEEIKRVISQTVDNTIIH